MLDTLRPQTFAEFHGQDKAVKLLKAATQAARERNEPLDHVLLCGPPGLGKTTLANIVAHESGHDTKAKLLSAPLLNKKDLLVALQGTTRSVVFIDEIHRLTPITEETLYEPMEDFRFHFCVGKNTCELKLVPFTLAGATTMPGHLSAPLRSRFGITVHLDFYTPEELARIVLRSAEKLHVSLDDETALEIGRRSRGTPRTANLLLRRLRDAAQLQRSSVITHDIAKQTLLSLAIDSRGLQETDRRFLRTLIVQYHGGPVGLNALASTIAETETAIEEMYEPYLLQIGMLERTSRGRKATTLAYQHLGLRERQHWM